MVITALTRNQVYRQRYRGFESHPLRQISTIPNWGWLIFFVYVGGIRKAALGGMPVACRNRRGFSAEKESHCLVRLCRLRASSFTQSSFPKIGTTALPRRGWESHCSDFVLLKGCRVFQQTFQLDSRVSVSPARRVMTGISGWFAMRTGILRLPPSPRLTARIVFPIV